MIQATRSCKYGAPHVQAVLRAHGRRIGRARIAKLIQRAGIRCLAALPRRTRTTDSRHDYPIASHLLARNFTTTQRNQVWLPDITHVATKEGRLYVAGILDLGARKLVDWSMSETLHAEGTLEALRMAVDRKRSPTGPIHHSDRGIQYEAETYRRAPATATIMPFMRRKGDCRDKPQWKASFTHSKPNTFTIATTPAEMKRDGTCSDISRAFITLVACTPLSAIYPRPITSAERRNPIHFFGGRSVLIAV